MFKHGASLRSRLVVAFLATALFLVPAKAQEVTVTVEISECWLHCHLWTKSAKMVFRWTDETAQYWFTKCMEQHCGGM